MPPANRFRIVLLLAALAVLVGLAWWWSSPEGAEPSASRTSDGDGRAQLTGLEAARSSPSPSDPQPTGSASPGSQRPIRPLAGRASRDEEQPAGILEGLVLSTRTREPVSGAELLFDHLGTLHAVATSATGAFSFRPATEGEYLLTRIAADGFFPFAPEWGYSPIAFIARRGQAIGAVTLWLDEAIDYIGVVENGRGERVPGATIVGYPLRGVDASEHRGDPAFTSDANGEFKFRLPSGSVLEASHPEHGRDRRAVDLNVLTHGRMLFKLRADAKGGGEGSLSGIVVDGQGNGVPQASVEARLSHSASPGSPAIGSLVAATVATAEGAFELTGLEAGTYELSATSEGYAKGTSSGVAAGAHGVVLTLASEVRIAGRVTDADSSRPVVAFVVLVSEPGLSRHPVASTSIFDGDGRFEVGNLSASTPYVVNVFAHGYATSPDMSVTTGSETDPPRELRIALERGAKLVGSVRAADARTPISGADVMLEGHLGEATSAASIVVSAETDPLGAFELLGAPPGLRSIRVSARGYHSRILGPFEVPDRNNAVVGPLLVELSRAAEGEEPGIELVGIGAALRPDAEWFVIEQVIAGGGAARAGLSPGDHVLAVDGVAVTVLGFEGAVQRIRGPEGTQVLLRVHRDGPPTDVAVERVRIRG
jgi:hypothetical protein